MLENWQITNYAREAITSLQVLEINNFQTLQTQNSKKLTEINVNRFSFIFMLMVWKNCEKCALNLRQQFFFLVYELRSPHISYFPTFGKVHAAANNFQLLYLLLFAFFSHFFAAQAPRYVMRVHTISASDIFSLFLALYTSHHPRHVHVRDKRMQFLSLSPENMK